MLSINQLREAIGLPPHKHRYRLSGLIDTADELGMLRFYEFECTTCGQAVAIERTGFRRVLLGQVQ